MQSVMIAYIPCTFHSLPACYVLRYGNILLTPIVLTRSHKSFVCVVNQLHSRHCLKMSIPNKSLQRRTVQSEILIPWVPRSAWSWYAVISSWRRIRCSTKHLTSHDTIDGLPDPGRRTIEPVSSYFFRNLSTPHLLASKLFSWRWQAIVRGLYLRKQ